MKSIGTFLLILFIPFLGLAQNIIVSNPKENVIYLGLSNKLMICVEGYKCNDFTLITDNGKIEKTNDPCSYVIKPVTVGVANISVSRKRKSQVFRTVKLRVKNIPPPIAMLNQKEGGGISRSVLKVQLGLVAQVLNMDIGTRILITGYTIAIYRQGRCVFLKVCDGQIFSDDVKAAFSSVQTSDKLIFSSISYRGPAIEGVLQPIEFEIVD